MDKLYEELSTPPMPTKEQPALGKSIDRWAKWCIQYDKDEALKVIIVKECKVYEL